MKNNQNRQTYELIYRKEFRLVPDYKITEEEYFEYYQNASDPTFENYPFKMKVEYVTTEIVSYYDTAVNILKQGKQITLMAWVDFQRFVSEWILREKWDSSYLCPFKNDGMPLITTKTDEQIGKIKCLWLTKKYSHKYPVGVKTVRELGYLISQAKATKGVIVTTSRLSKGALRLIEANRHVMSYIGNEILEKQLKTNDTSDDIAGDLPF